MRGELKRAVHDLKEKRLLETVRHAKSTPLAVGDVVRLKSGGPAMTVTGVFDVSATVEVTQYRGDLREVWTFEPVCLERVPEPADTEPVMGQR